MLAYYLVYDMEQAGNGDETVKFELDGAKYEIELSRENAKMLREQLQPWIFAARRTGGRRQLRQALTESAGRVDAAAQRRVTIRKWAHKNGYGVAVFGRIPRDVVDAYLAATGEGADTDAALDVCASLEASGVMIRPRCYGTGYVVL